MRVLCPSWAHALCPAAGAGTMAYITIAGVLARSSNESARAHQVSRDIQELWKLLEFMGRERELGASKFTRWAGLC